MALNRTISSIYGNTVGQPRTSTSNIDIPQEIHYDNRLDRTAPTPTIPASDETLARDVDDLTFITKQEEARETTIEDSSPFEEKNVEMALRELHDSIETENLWDRTGTTLEPHNAGDGIDVADIEVTTGSTIDEFSIDGTLAGNSDTALPTERAVKTYTDTQLAAKTHASLQLLQVDDHSNVYDRVVGRDGSIVTKAALDIAYPPAVAYRGWTALVIGGAGARDREYRCMKGDGGAYMWVEVMNGGL